MGNMDGIITSECDSLYIDTCVIIYSLFMVNTPGISYSDCDFLSIDTCGISLHYSQEI